VIDQPLRCLWIGPTGGGLSWLRKRLDTFRVGQRPSRVIERPGIDRQQLLQLVASGLDRVIVACPGRLDAPRDILALLRECSPEVPCTVTGDSWWDGAPRTGLRTPGYLFLPWYRWWDGWTAWLAGTLPELFEPFPLDQPWSTFPSPSAADHGMGWLVGNCPQMLQAWALTAAACGHATHSWPGSLGIGSARVGMGDGHQRQGDGQGDGDTPSIDSQHNFRPAPSWVLWDDTASDTVHGYHQVEQAMRNFFTNLYRSHPHVLAIAAVSLPRADVLEDLSRCHPRFEFFVKPSSGHALAQLLRQTTGCD
jgi:hypothetical protein